MDKVAFDCSAWSIDCIVKLAHNKSLLIGVVYRSPNSTDENNRSLLNLLQVASTNNCDYLNICSDFNLPLIAWSVFRSLESENSFSAEFIDVVEGLAWCQHAGHPTQFRGSQNSCLDLIFTNEVNMVDKARELPPLGKSDYICQHWSITVSETLFKNTSVMRPNFKRAKWADLKRDLRNYRNASEDQPSTMYDKFVRMIGEVKRRHIPNCKPWKNKHRSPWMKGAGIRTQRTAQWRSLRNFRQSGHPRDYDAYKMERNRLTDMVRTAKAKYERQLIVDMKDNPNLYHGHCRRTLKTKQGMTNVVGGDGTLTETEIQTAEELNVYYYSAFTRDEGVTPPPDFPETTQEKLVDVNFSVETVEGSAKHKTQQGSRSRRG